MEWQHRSLLGELVQLLMRVVLFSVVMVGTARERAAMEKVIPFLSGSAPRFHCDKKEPKFSKFSTIAYG